LGVRHVMLILGPPTAAAVIMWLAIWAIRPYSVTWLDVPALLLAAHVLFGVFVYAVALHTASRQYFADFVDLGKRLIKRSPS